MHLLNSVFKYNNLQIYLCKALVSSNAAGFPVYYKRYSGLQPQVYDLISQKVKTDSDIS